MRRSRSSPHDRCAGLTIDMHAPSERMTISTCETCGWYRVVVDGNTLLERNGPWVPERFEADLRDCARAVNDPVRDEILRLLEHMESKR